MSNRRIVGVCLVKNEENFIGWALSNVVDFCDEILVMENHSEDRTTEIVHAFAKLHDHVRVITVPDANKTHAHVEHWAGTDTWVFGVDGDEIYDREGLARLRPRILSGEFDDYWRIFGHTIHARALNFEEGWVAGYAAPQARSISKLYNFAGISSWHQPNHERLHGKDMEFRPGYHFSKAYEFWSHETWDQSDCRCLHLCFAPRSSADAVDLPRNNPVEVKKGKRVIRNLTDTVARWIDANHDRKRNYKLRHYSAGEVVTCPLGGFGRPRDFGELVPHAADVDTMLSAGAWSDMPLDDEYRPT